MINILHNFIEGPWGGGNQFLKGLRNYLIKRGLYTDNILAADAVLVNSKDNLNHAYKIKKQLNKKIIHRIDGVFGIYRGDPSLDTLVHNFANNVADGIIYQSEWSMECHKQRGLKDHKKETVIYNAANPDIFNLNYDKVPNKKIKLITTSWSSNWGKGFKTLQYLDDNLDFNKYEYDFVGQSPVKFKNINMTQALPQEELAKRIRKSDIFFTATENDTCSNSLLEALSCGLPAIGLHSGGTPELIREGGETYSDKSQLLSVIDKVSLNVESYREKIQVENMDQIGNKYYEFIIKK